MRRIRYTRQARADLIDIWLWIAREGDARADAVLNRIESRISLLAEHSEAGPRRREIAEDARSLLAERWLVLYRLTPDGVQVVRIVDGSRDVRRLGWLSGTGN